MKRRMQESQIITEGSKAELDYNIGMAAASSTLPVKEIAV